MHHFNQAGVWYAINDKTVILEKNYNNTNDNVRWPIQHIFANFYNYPDDIIMNLLTPPFILVVKIWYPDSLTWKYALSLSLPSALMPMINNFLIR